MLNATNKNMTSEQLRTGLENLPAWKVNPQGRLEREFVFESFPEAFSFMTRVAFEAERMNHHPDWTNSYNRVKVELMTHDAGTITKKDLELAERIDKICWI